ncbi:hypothetical protein [Thalassolituus sp. C2-1]|uniref:hypothetical protein n=1 Tax=Venatorbacter sp. C2-1 TaxID=2597518 RepID=UPI00119722E8|nr:hypothetical protein [Thalassolituus sp. C2-1]TVV42556.1 hypothetical protein FOT50_13835 [Thalassolituus sp. C2-1]
MTRLLILATSVLLLSACSQIETQTADTEAAAQVQSIPEPPTWRFPDIMEAARELVPLSIEGKPFNRHGFAYPIEELKQLDVKNMSAAELQNYADVTTHAYPDALGRQIADECDSTEADELSNRAIATVAYVSFNAIDAGIRSEAAACLARVQADLQRQESH